MTFHYLTFAIYKPYYFACWEYESLPRFLSFVHPNHVFYHVLSYFLISRFLPKKLGRLKFAQGYRNSAPFSFSLSLSNKNRQM